MIKLLDAIRNGFMVGIVSKDDYEKALRAHKEATDEMKSDQRDAAVADSIFGDTSIIFDDVLVTA